MVKKWSKNDLTGFKTEFYEKLIKKGFQTLFSLVLLNYLKFFYSNWPKNDIKILKSNLKTILIELDRNTIPRTLSIETGRNTISRNFSIQFHRKTILRFFQLEFDRKTNSKIISIESDRNTIQRNFSIDFDWNPITKIFWIESLNLTENWF